MQSENTNEKIPIVPQTSTTPDHDRQMNSSISKIKIVLLVILAFQLILSLFDFIERIVSLAEYYQLPPIYRSGSLVGTYIGSVAGVTILVVYLIVFIILVAQLNRIGIFIFAWLAVLELIVLVVIIVLAIIEIVTYATVFHNYGSGFILSVIILVVTVCVFLLTILTIILAFRLTKLLKKKEAYQPI